MSTLVTADFVAPAVAYSLVLPMLVVFGGALLGVLVEAFAPRSARYEAQVGLTLVTLAAAFIALVQATNEPKAATLSGSVVIDGPALFLQGAILLFAALAVLTMAERFTAPAPDAFTPQGASSPGSPYEAAAARAGWSHTEVYPLLLFSVGGMMLFPAANDLLTLFVALEVFSLPLYLLCGLARRRRLLSQESALKYFLLGAFSSAFFLFGAALVFGFAGSLYLGDISTAISSRTDSEGLLGLGVAMVLIGLLFKVGAVPFHSWTPDVYQGAPTPITGFMAAATKAAAFGALLRIGYVAFPGSRWDWQPILWAVAIITMLFGAVLAITQTDVKRLLAYSSIAHAGFLLTGVLAFDRSGLSGTLFYLAAYGCTTIGAFAVITLVRDDAGEATHLSQWAGLGRRSPLLAGIFAFLLLALAGLPLTSGFSGKFAVFSAAVAHGGTWLVVVGIISSAIAAFFYVRIIVLMFFTDPTGTQTEVWAPSILTTITVAMSVLITALLGIYPGPLLELANQASIFVQ